MLGKAAESFSDADVAALVIVVIGFVVYSSDGIGLSPLSDTEGDSQKLRHRMLPFQRGSIAYLQRSNSDPNMFWSPSFTPKSSSSRFGRYSPATKMIRAQQSPHVSSRLMGSSPNHGTEVVQKTYNALSSFSPPILISSEGGFGDLEMEMPPSIEASSL